MRKKKQIDGMTLAYFAFIGLAELCKDLAAQIQPAEIQKAKLAADQKRNREIQLDTIRRFLSEKTTADPEAKTKAGRLYAAFVQWYQDPAPIMSKKMFGLLLPEFYPKTKDGYVFYYGLKLMDDHPGGKQLK